MMFSEGIKSASTNDGGRLLWEGHRQRLRQRMEREGWDALKPYEMVELVLYNAVPRQDLSDVSRLLVDRFGSVGGVFAATREQLLSVEGVTETLARWIGLTGELMRAYCDLHAQTDIRLSSYRQVRAFLEPRLDQGDGRPWAIYADFDFNLICCAPLDGAGPWWGAANARRILTDAIDGGARYVFLVLWGGDALPALTGEDEEILDALAVTLRAAEIDLLDCLLVGGGEIYSMNTHGRMKGVRAVSGQAELHERYAGEENIRQ